MEKQKNLKTQVFLKWISICFIGGLLLYILYNSFVNYEVLSQNGKIKTGDHAPTFELLSTKGESVDIKNLRGKVLILFFFNTNCNSCAEEAPLWYMIKSKYDSTKIKFIGVCSSGLDEIEKFLIHTKLNIPVLLDGGDVRKLYQIEKEPEVFLIDEDGKIAFTNKNIPTDEGLQILNEKLKHIFEG
ncbi:MAG: redoxin domain-containing protein [Ignavibacteriales bacterium]|nr:redoxin domain-containing protein [Ignavibacteriales bacterium]